MSMEMDEEQPLNPEGAMMDEAAAEDEGPTCTDKYEAALAGEKFVQDYDKLAEDRRSVVYDADRETPYGIRSHPEMSVGMSLASIFVPWHVDWLPILLYLGFTLYFWVQLVQLLIQSDEYSMKSKRDYDLMTIATIGIVISLTSSSLNLLFFSISERARGAFSTLDFMGRTTMVFLFTMAFVASEVHGSNEYAKAEKTRYHDKNAKEPEPIKAKANNETISEPREYTYQGEDNKYYEPYMYVLMLVLLANLILSFWSWGKKIALWLSVTLLTIVYASDYLYFSRDDQKLQFYMPIFVELSFLAIGYMFYLFRLPERWCSKARFVQLYVTGFIFLQIFYLNFIYEAHSILYYIIKLNSRTYADEELEVDDGNWWHESNIFKKGHAE